MHPTSRKKTEDTPPQSVSALRRRTALLLIPLAALSAPRTLPAGEKPATAPPSEGHWAFLPIRRPEVPRGKAAWDLRNPADAFVAARLEAEGLEPAPPADRATLIRRLSLDLTGLPPAPEEVEDFLAAERPDAYERLADRLFASPHFGERWAVDWLDAARYADTNGYEKDRPRVMWRYRDWVIDAFNRDLPFDRFTIEQLAGDLLPGAGLSQLIATGFHRNTLINEEGGVDQEEYRFQALVDRVNTTGTVFLGLTIACAQCHDHKYDPITQREYYELLAFFNAADDITIEVPTEEERERRRAHAARIRELEDRLYAPAGGGAGDVYAEVDAKRAAWEAAARAKAHRWRVLEPLALHSEGGAELRPLGDGSILAGGPSPQHDTYRLEFAAPLERITAFRIEVLPHESLPGGGPGRGRVLSEGNFVLSEVKIRVHPPLAAGTDANPAVSAGERPGSGQPPEATEVPLVNASASREAKRFPAKAAADGDIETGWSTNAHEIGGRFPHALVLEVGGGGVRIPRGAKLEVELVQYYVHEHTLGRFRISATADPPPVRASGLPAEVEAALLVPQAERVPAQEELIRRRHRWEAEELQDIVQEIVRLKSSPPRVTTALVMRERKMPRPTHVHIRGEYLRLGDPVEPDVPACLPPLPEDAPRNRLGLARWLVSDANPLTARVTANRIWQALFGRGIVSTPEDFGTQGSPPSHPRLLDWLASEFREGGWSWKRAVRRIVLSATYRRSAARGPELERRDPENVLLARGPRFRLGAEFLRDAALRASGLLEERIGGPSVFPPQPPGVTDLSYGRLEWKTSAGADRYRRGLYTFWKRTSPYAAFALFDAPSRETCTVKRPRTNTPLQALVLLNDAVFIEAARSLAGRVLEECPEDDPSRVRRLFLRVLARKPTAKEVETVLAFVTRERLRFLEDPQNARRLAGSGGSEAPDDPQRAAEIAAWTLAARAVLNLDEAVTKP